MISSILYIYIFIYEKQFSKHYSNTLTFFETKLIIMLTQRGCLQIGFFLNPSQFQAISWTKRSQRCLSRFSFRRSEWTCPSKVSKQEYLLVGGWATLTTNYTSQVGNLLFGVNIKYVWNHQLEECIIIIIIIIIIKSRYHCITDIFFKWIEGSLA